jgi:deazaflavin-dependent oxidoreductase (nitroreductase family)
MPEKVGKAEPPKGFSRLLWRAPIWIYRLGLGGLIKKRMLLLQHTGRKSGLPRQNVLEIVDHDEATDTYYVASGFGKKSDWYKNIVKQPNVTITVGRKEIPVMAAPLSPDESGQALVAYAHRNPTAAKNLMKICGYKVDGSDEDYFIIGRDIVPFIALKPRS